jgi:serine/threonine protein kinase
MAEPQIGPHGPIDPKEGLSSPPVIPEGGSTSILIHAPPISDDAPTIISRTRPKSLHAEDLLKADLRGCRLAHFELLEPIGAGGMAAVIRARDTQLDRTVALKILPPETAANPESVLRFQQEARAAAKLDHENIARVFFCGEDQGLHFISFEFVEGENLRTHIQNHGKLPVADAVNYLTQIAGGLVHAAERGVVHRDIKPSNIIITPDGKAKLVDMGLARSVEPHAELALTQSGVTLGTFDYISPEQALEPREADTRSDIYSLGCTFYHALSGKKPVPDGTAAKKLHHHQNVKPIDPRKLNSEIPDELAGILGRMMAKDPNDRYQRPEELVQHLVNHGRKLGGLPKSLSGAWFVESTAPARRPNRIGWIAGAAAAVGLASFFIYELWPHLPGPWHLASRNGSTERGRATASNNLAQEGNAEKEIKSPLVAPKIVPQVVKNREELSAALETLQPQMDIRLATDLIDLNQDRERPLGLKVGGDGCQVTIQPAENLPHRPVIRLKSSPDLEADSVWAALTVQAGRVTLRHLRFEVDAAEAPGIQMAAVRLQESGELTIEDCEFEQVGASPTSRLSSVLVDGPSADAFTPYLVIQKCFFTSRESAGSSKWAEGQDAVTLNGSAWARITNCAFGPHAALAHFLKGKSKFEIHNESALLTNGTAFLMESGAGADISMYESLISCPDNRLTSGGATLINQKGGGPEDVEFTGRWNCYHDLDDFWIANGQPLKSKTWPADDQNLAMSPWMDKDPLARLKEGNPKQAFQPDLRKTELQFADRWVGAHKCTWGPVYDVSASDDKKTELAANTLIVDPNVAMASGRVYPRLNSAINDAKPGDTILLKHGSDRLVKIDMVRLEKPDIDLTIKPYEGFHPILTLGRSTESETGMFRLHDGKLRLKDLEFLLSSDSTDYQSRAVVSVVGDGECLISNCVVTLDKGEGNPDRDFALVTLVDTANVMKMEPLAPQRIPEIRVENCFVRGKGELLAVRSSRPFHLQADKSLVALDGNLLAVKGSSRELPLQPGSSINLARVTTYLTHHLISLKGLEQVGKSSKGLVQTQVASAADCLFAAAAGESLVHLDGLDNQDDMTKYFTWNENRNNSFSNYENRYLDQQTPNQVGGPMAFDRAKWDRFTNGNGVRYETVKFSSAPPPDSPLNRVLATDFRVIQNTNSSGPEYGAVINDLPAPFGSSPAPTDK